ncbi:MAG TPA: sodium:proton antiporter NhaD [Chlamydiales bacterium]|jgi:NhaD family Na+/H+ antiporter|nr:sodium:proton antiporter NhaD [Chlamydiales bacterium]
MFEAAFANILIISAFTVGYLCIIFEYNIKINKTASALLMAALTWTVVFLIQGVPSVHSSEMLADHLSDVSQIIFFLLSAMTLVELIDRHKGFKVITDLICTNSKRKLFWLIGIITFFLSAILDNLTTTIVMVSLLRKLVADREDRLLLGAMVVIAANAGGAWTPIGDVTTTMLWINGNITTLAVMKTLFLPSLATLLVCIGFMVIGQKGSFTKISQKAQNEPGLEPGGKLIFYCGIGALIFVPVFKTLTGLPPYMGMLLALGVLWLITDLMHHRYEGRQHLRIPQILTHVDTSGVLFFLGILLCIGSLEAVGLLKELAHLLDVYIHNLPIIATCIGLLSAIVDNVPLVAACMGMYSLQVQPVDAPFWQLIAFTAGTGGSILVIGSAAGVALMGLEKVNFIWYFKRVSWIALLSFFAGIGVYLAQEAIVRMIVG